MQYDILIVEDVIFMEYINGHDLYQMFMYGSVKVQNMRETLNEINVFPVPDSDTGNNLASTMQAIAKQAKKDESFHHALEIISESALYGARGNSGVIFAQFVNGLRSASKGKEQVTIEEFADMVKESVDYTYKSLSNPVEGTMLTVIKDWGNSLLHMVKEKFTDVKHVFAEAFKHAKVSLEETKSKLPVLKKNNVVDSGAMGFVLFLQGIESYYNQEILEAIHYEEIEMDDTHKHDETVNFRYCTEGLVRSQTNFDEDALRETLNGYGDSLIIAKGLNIFRVHIHTNHPEWVFQELKLYGTIINQKVDNMILDIALENTEERTLVITDSIADISPEFIQENNILVIPLNVQADETDYLDKLTINNEILFNIIPDAKSYPTTATPTLKKISDLMDKWVPHFEEVVVLTVAAKLSATHQLIIDAAQKHIDEGKKIHIIDTLNNSATEGLLVKKAVEMIQKGVKIDQVVAEIEEAKHKTRILVCLNTFKYAMMGGRVPKTVGKIGNFLGMRPIMTLDKEGHGAAFGIAFSQKGLTKKIIKNVKQDMEEHGIESYALVHCLNDDLVEEYRTTFTELIGFGPEYITEVSSAVAIHSGIGTVAIGYIHK